MSDLVRSLEDRFCHDEAENPQKWFYHGEAEVNVASISVSPNHVVCDVNFWYHRQLNHQQEASPRNFNQS